MFCLALDGMAMMTTVSVLAEQISICRQRLIFCPAEGEEGMSQICNCSSRNSVTFRDVKACYFEVATVSECGKEAVTTSAVRPDVDRATGYSDNPKHSCQSFLCGYL